MNVLREKRLAHRYSLQDVAERIGVSRQMIFQYETGQRKPNLERLEQLAVIYGTTTDELLGRGKSNGKGL